MKKITKEELIDKIINSVSSNDKANKEIKKMINQFYDLSLNQVKPFNEKETFIFRKRNGILDNGICQTISQVSEITNVTLGRIQQYEEIMRHKMDYYINYIINYPYDLNVITLKTIIEELNFSNNTYNTLKNNNINTLEDLTNLTLIKLKKIPRLGILGYNEVVDKINSLGFNFTVEKEINQNSPIERLNLSTRTCNGLKRNGINTIYDLYNSPLDKLKWIGITSINEIKIKLKDFNFEKMAVKPSIDYQIPIENLNFSYTTFCKLKQNGINTIKDLKGIKTFNKFIDSTSIKEVISKMKELGIISEEDFKIVNDSIVEKSKNTVSLKKGYTSQGIGDLSNYERRNKR